MANKLEKLLFGKQLLELRKEERATNNLMRDIVNDLSQKQEAKKQAQIYYNARIEQAKIRNQEILELHLSQKEQDRQRAEKLRLELVQETAGDHTPQEVIDEIEHPQVMRKDELEKAA